MHGYQSTWEGTMPPSGSKNKKTKQKTKQNKKQKNKNKNKTKQTNKQKKTLIGEKNGLKWSQIIFTNTVLPDYLLFNIMETSVTQVLPFYLTDYKSWFKNPYLMPIQLTFGMQETSYQFYH